jgi:membrane protein
MHLPAACKSVYSLAKQAVMNFLDNGGPLLSAALAFYSILSIAPLALVAVYFAGLFFGEEAANAQLRHSLQDYVGEASADALASVMEKLRNSQGGRSASIVGFGLLFFGAARLFGQLQDALNQLWHVRTEFKTLKSGVLVTLYKKAVAFVLVVGFGALLSLLIVVSALSGAVKQVLGSSLPGSQWMWAVWPLVTTAVGICVAFTLIYRLMPDATVAWRDALVGAAVAGVLFALAEWPLSFYLSHQGVESAYGAAGSLVVLLLWIYYAAHIFFLGAQVSKVVADSQGRYLRPDAMAVLVRQVVVAPGEGAASPAADPPPSA